MKKLYLLINSLDIGRGGLTKANLQQANILNDLGYDTSILTFNYNGDYQEIIKEIYSIYNLNSKIKIINMYDYFRNEENTIEYDNTYENLIDKNVTVEKVNNSALRLYEKGLYKKYITFREDKSIRGIDYFSDSRHRLKSEFYTYTGYVGKVSYMDYNFNKPRQMTFHNSLGECYMSKWVNPENGKATKINIIQNNIIHQSFKNDNQLKTHFIEEIIKNDENPIIISDARNTDNIMIDVKDKHVKKNIRLHSNHLSPNGEVAKTVLPALENLGNINSLIVLTNQQKEDITANYGYSEKIKVIPNSIQTLFPEEINRIKKKNKAVVISRLVTLKQIDHIIKAISLIKKDNQEFILEIYGTGDELDNLKTLVKNNNLEKNVIFKGYTNNPLEIYKESLFSITTSKTEGFSLGILESMACGTPVISYDFNYGPQEIIDNNKNGLIINKDNIKELSENIVYLKNNEKVLKEMSEKSIEKIEKKFSIDRVKKEWFEFIEKNNIIN